MMILYRGYSIQIRQSPLGRTADVTKVGERSPVSSLGGGDTSTKALRKRARDRIDELCADEAPHPNPEAGSGE